jgi:ribonuclease BN (tRNA processing enzyme)
MTLADVSRPSQLSRLFKGSILSRETSRRPSSTITIFSAPVKPVFMQVTFLGTNGWFDTDTGNTVSVLVQTREYDIIFDAGNGIAKADRYISQEKPVILFLSHFHIDHISGLHTLVKFHFKQGLKIYCQPGGAALLHTFVGEPFTVPLEKLPYSAHAIELEEGVHKLPFMVECRPLIHPAPCYGYRVEIDDKVITFCTDTGVCDNAVRLARNADLLITECALKPGEESPGWPHLNPQEAIGIAGRAKAKRLALLHFGAEVYKTIDERKAVQEEFGKLFPGLIAATDGLTVEI